MKKTINKRKKLFNAYKRFHSARFKRSLKQTSKELRKLSADYELKKSQKPKITINPPLTMIAS